MKTPTTTAAAGLPPSPGREGRDEGGPQADKAAPTPEEIAAEAKKVAEAKAAAQKKLDDQCLALREIAAKGREEAKKLRDRADAIERQAGDLEGSVITARDIGIKDLGRALLILDRAKDSLRAPR